MSTSNKSSTSKIAAIVAVAFVVGLAIGVPISIGGGDAGEHTGHEHGSGSGEAEAEVWTCSMHPQIKLPEAGSCPICGMDLIPLEKTEGDEPTLDQVVLSERAKALARIETVSVRRAAAAVEKRLLGRLAYDETKVRTITPWTDGRIDRLFVSAVGEKIKRGKMIASIYSPEIYAAQVDLLQAKKQVERLGKALPIAKKAAKSAQEASRTRLRLLGVAPGEVEKMAANETPTRNVAVTAHYAGTIVEQMVHEGAYVKAGTPLFRTADLSTIWAQLDAYEEDLSTVAVGQSVTLMVSSFPGESFEGEVAFVDPIVDRRTRTAQIRVVIDNEDGRLSPGMFADAIVHAADPDAEEQEESPLVIPFSAPLFTGKRSVVYVELPDKARPTYEAKVVRLGPRAGDYYAVLEGLAEGDRVVVRGAFVLDSDLQIRGGRSMMTKDDDLAREALRPVRVNEAFMKGFGRVLDAYLDVSEALAADDVAAAKKAFANLQSQADGFDPQSPQEARDVYLPIGKKVAAEAGRAAELDDLAMVRGVFADISEQLVVATRRFGNPLEGVVRMATCPMARDGKGAPWLQRKEEVHNPYYGSEMLSCGDIDQTVAPGTRAAEDAEASDPPDEHAGHTPVKPPKPAAAKPQKPGPRATAKPKPAPPPAATPSYTCPMHPQIHEPHPGKCPICKMNLVPEKSGGGHGH